MTTAVLYHHPDDDTTALHAALAALPDTVTSIKPEVRTHSMIPRGRLFVVLSDAA